MQAKLTKRAVDTAESEPLGDLWVWDTEIKGFGLRVRPNGRKTYVIEYRPGLGGRSSPKRRYVIGRHGMPWTADTARTEATKILGLVATGQDPAAEKSLGRKASTVKELGESFIEQYAKRHQRRWDETERVFKKEIYPVIGGRRLAEVTRHDIANLIDDVAKRGPVMAGRTLAYIRKFFNWSIERGHLEINPCSKIRTADKSHSRERVLADDELREIWLATDHIGKHWSDIIRLLILTAQRRSEVAEMMWSEIDFEKHLWTIPGTRAKNHRTHEVPLSASAIKILQRQIRINNGPFVFSTTGKTAVSGFSRAKRCLDKVLQEQRDKLPIRDQDRPKTAWVLHDLRRTAVTGLARLGIAPHIADAVLNHKEGAIHGVAAVYNRHAYIDDRRAALELWEKHIVALLKSNGTAAEQTNKIIRLRKGSSK